MADVNFGIDLVNTVQERMSHRVRRFGFGDGYEQIAADGVNSRMVEYDITTRPLKVADATTMRTALDNAAIGDYLLCTLEPYSNIQRRYISLVRSWSSDDCLSSLCLSSAMGGSRALWAPPR